MHKYVLMISAAMAAAFYLCVFFHPAAWAGQLPGEKFQALIDSAVCDFAPGIIMAVGTSQEVWIGAAGKADIATGEKMDPGMQMRIASVTKQFTAFLVMQLVDEGKLALDDTLEKLLPGTGIPNAPKITLRRLLDHTSGIFDHESDENRYWARFIEAPEKGFSDTDVINIVKKNKPDFAPGEKYRYCNTNFYLLGMIAEKVTGKTVAEEMQRRFFKPFGMDRTAVTREGKLTPPASRHYYLNTLTKATDEVSHWNMSWDWTAGSGVSTASDMIKWSRAVFGGKIVRPETLAAMTTAVPPSKNYGLGLTLINKSGFGARCVWHSGANHGSTCMWLNFVDEGYYAFFIINRFDEGGGEKNQFKVLDALLKGLGGILKEIK